jgi:serine protease
MKHHRQLLASTIAAVMFWALSPAWAADYLTVEKPVPNQYIVVLKEQAARLAGESRRSVAVSVSEQARTLAKTYRISILGSYDHVLPGFSAKIDEATLQKLLADDRVDYIEQDGYVEAYPTQTGATWGIDRVDQRQLPLSTTYTYNTTANGVHAYVIDTGVLGSHSQFDNRPIGNGFTSIIDGNGTNDCNGHGTHVAGTLGGKTWGIAKEATIHPVRVLNCAGSGTFSGVIAGMNWVSANRILPAVANMSLGGGASTSLDTAAVNLSANGVTVVVAAGNNNGNACSSSPARASTIPVPSAVITVGSTDSNDSRSSFSNFGTCLSLFAPGRDITSAWHTGTAATNTISGTSMAAPHVAGAAALLLAAQQTATPAQIKAQILQNATPNVIGNPGAGSPNLLLYTLSACGAAQQVFQQSDISGRVTIAVFERCSSTLSQHNTDFAVQVPPGYVVIGGGGEGKKAPGGNLLTASYPNAGLTEWRVSTKDHQIADPVSVRAWAIGLKVNGLTPAQLISHLTVATATSSNAAHPDVTANLPAGYVLLGGGFKVNWSGMGNLGTASAPSGAYGWRVRSKDHNLASPATAQAFVIGLRESIPGIGSFISTVNTATSAPAAHPAGSVTLANGYALSGCGAYVNFSGNGNVLWKIKPLTPAAGKAACEVSSKDHVVSDPTTIAIYSMGLRSY